LEFRVKGIKVKESRRKKGKRNKEGKENRE